MDDDITIENKEYPTKRALRGMLNSIGDEMEEILNNNSTKNKKKRSQSKNPENGKTVKLERK